MCYNVCMRYSSTEQANDAITSEAHERYPHVFDARGELLTQACTPLMLKEDQMLQECFLDAPQTDAWWNVLQDIVADIQKTRFMYIQTVVYRALQRCDDPVSGLQRVLKKFPKNHIWGELDELWTGPLGKKLSWQEVQSNADAKRKRLSFFGLNSQNLIASMAHPTWLKSIQQHLGGLAAVYTLLNIARNNLSYQIRFHEIKMSLPFADALQLQDSERQEVQAYLSQQLKIEGALLPHPFSNGYCSSYALDAWLQPHALQPLVQDAIVQYLCSASTNEQKRLFDQNAAVDIVLYLNEKKIYLDMPVTEHSLKNHSLGWLVAKQENNPHWFELAQESLLPIGKKVGIINDLEHAGKDSYIIKHLHNALQEDERLTMLWAALLIESQILDGKNDFNAYTDYIRHMDPKMKENLRQKNGYAPIVKILQMHYPNITEEHVNGIVQAYTMLKGQRRNEDEQLHVLRTLVQKTCQQYDMTLEIELSTTP